MRGRRWAAAAPGRPGLSWTNLAATAAIIVLLAAYLAFYASGLGSPDQRIAVSDLAYIPLCLLATAMGLRAAWHPGLDRRTRRAWLLMSTAFGCQLLANAVWFWLQVVVGRTSYPAPSDIGYLAFIPVMFAALLMFPVARGSTRDLAVSGLDVLTVVTSGFMVVWYLVLGPTLAAHDASALATLTSVAYPVGDLALIAGVATVLLRRVAPASRRPLQIIVAGLLIYIATDLSYTLLGLQHGTVGSRWLDVCWMIADGLFALSAIDQHHQASRQGRSDSPGSVGAPTSRLPYLAVAVAYGLLLTMAGGQDLYSIGGMIVGAVLVTATVLLRQMSALHENRRLATIDSLTGIANRALVQQRLDAALALAGRRERRVAALVIDLDRFKSVNDTLGHDAGDALLATVASRLSSVLRASELAGRLGGDEFAVIITDLPDDTAAQAVADRILMALHPPIEFGPHLLTAPASIGVAVCGADLKNGDELLRRADIAMYAAKRDGGRRYRVYTPALETGSLMPDLLRAIHDGELTLHYQPIFDLEADRLAGFEALVRWPHPERGLLGSAEFVPLAEETGMIVPMGAWVLREACAQMRRWEQRSPHAGCLMLNVNVSALQVRSPDALGEIGEIVRQNGYDPRRLVLELTEGALPHDDAPALAQIEGLRQMGIRIAIDDFGTGYSTLSRLRRLPVDILKIDRSFVTDIEESEDGRTMAAAMVNLGQALKLSVVAEGIETAGQLRALREMRCGYGQGFYFARPLVPELAAQLIDQPLAPASVVSIGRR